MESIVNWPGWEFVRRLGGGSYGEVYEIRQQIGSFERRAALKVIPVPRDAAELHELYSQGYDNASIERSLREQVENVVREFSVMFDLRECPNVVRCEELRIVDRPDGVKGKDICMQMELLTPLSLMLHAEDAQTQAIRVGMDLLNALAFCRKLKIVHRDIKPQNIFVSPKGEYKLGDFGVAKTMDRTGSATMIGTINYMAPEVHSVARYGSSADVYSLGLVLYWLLNERHLPFVPILNRPAKQSEVEQAVSRRFQGEPIPFPKNGSEELCRLVCSMCAFRPEDRPSVETLRAAFALLAGSTEPTPEPAPEEAGTVGVWGTKQLPPEKTDYANSEYAYPNRNANTESAYSFKQTGEMTELEPDRERMEPPPGRNETPFEPPVRNQPYVPAKPRRKRWIPWAAAAAVIGLLLIGFFTIHIYEPATYTQPKTCKICGATVGNVKGYIDGYDISLSRSETEEDLGDWTGYPFLTSDIENCIEMTISLSFDSDDDPEQLYGTWDLYLRDLSGNWSAVGTFQVEYTVNDYTFDFETPVSFNAYHCLPEQGESVYVDSDILSLQVYED